MTAPFHAQSILVFAIVAASLTGCNSKNADPASNVVVGSDTGSGSGAVAEDGQAKFDHYTKAYNVLIQDVPWNMPKTASDFDKLDLSKVKISEEISYPETSSLLSNALTELKAGRALKAEGAATVDTAADQMIQAGQTLVARWEVLNPYFKTRAYRDDKLAKAKAAEPTMRKAYADMTAGMKRLSDALSEHQQARATAQKAVYQKQGNMAAYHAVDTMLIADRFSTAVIADDFATADRILPDLTSATEALRAAGVALPASDDNKNGIGEVTRYMSDAIGSYRDYKQNKETSDLEETIKSYNEAVNASNELKWEKNP